MKWNKLRKEKEKKIKYEIKVELSGLGGRPVLVARNFKKYKNERKGV